MNKVSKTITTYVLSVEDLKNLMANEVNTTPDKVQINFLQKIVGDDRFDGGDLETYAVEVVVSH